MPIVPWPANVHLPPMPLNETHVTPWTKQPGDGDYLNVFVRGPIATTPDMAETMAAAERNEISPYKLAAVGSDGAIKLRDYQTEALAALDNAWQEGKKAPLIVLPCGVGKTIIGAQSMNRLFQTRGYRSLFLAHRKELLDQTAEKIRLVSPRMRVGIVQANRNEMGRDVTIASIQTLGHQSGRRLEAILDDGPIGLVVCDEAHRAVSPQWVRVLNAIKERYPDVLLYGLTATPGRADGVALDRVFDDVCFYRSIQTMIDLGYLVPPKGYKVTLDIDLDTVETRKGDFVQKQLSQLMNTPSVVRAVVRAWCEFGHDRKTIVFAVDIAHAHALAEEFCDAGYKAEAVDSKTKKRERAAIFKRYRSGETKILSQCEIATEGFDDPSTEVILHARPTQSQSLYIQCLDSVTEVLTQRGWLGPDEISDEDIIGTLNTERALFEWSPVLSRVDRPLHPQESMWAISLPQINVRVTGKHQMVYRTRRVNEYQWSIAQQMPREMQLPVAAPSDIPDNPDISGDELTFLGWWYAEGSFNKANNALSLYQSPESSFIRDIEKAIQHIGVKYGRHETAYSTQYRDDHKMVHFTISRGKPRGRDRHKKGWEFLSPWIQQDGTKRPLPIFWSLSERQLLLFLDAFNKGDGASMTSPSVDYTPRTFRCYQKTGIEFHETIQALCVTRGIRCNVYDHVVDGTLYKQFAFTPGKTFHSVSADRPELRMHQTVRFFDERVWCVETTTGTIVTRRNGRCAILGNCTGRGLRPYPAKTECIIIDCVGNSDRHSIMQLASLSGFDPERALHGTSGDDGEEPEVGETPEVISAEISGEEIELVRRATQRSRYTWRQASIGWILQIPRIGYYLVAWHDRQHTKSVIRFYDQRPGRRDDPPREVLKDPVSFEIAYQMVEAECDRIFNARLYRKTAEFQDKDEPDDLPPEINFVDIDEGLDEEIHIPEAFMLKDAKWRSRPASAKQLGLLKKLGVKEKTMPDKAGEASDLIAILQVERDAKMRLPPTQKQLAYLHFNGLGNAKTKGAAARKIWQHRKAVEQ